MKMNYRVLGLVALTVLLSGCGSSNELPTGKIVTVQFRRDALGSAASIPISPTTDSLNGATLSLRGKLLDVTEDWVVLEYQTHQHWIPRDVVLLIRKNQ